MSTPLWTALEAAAATGGRFTRDWQATGVSIDTRTLQPGDLFVALTAARDGHEFVAQALAKGAAAALVSRIPEGVAEDAPLLIVDDVLDGLTALGRAGRARSNARIVAVTGSVGKTSTKEMLRGLLGRLGRLHVAEASYNNHWGVPLTLARMPYDTEVAVLEIGMNHPGEIAPLARLARPHVAMITTIAPAHMAAFGSLEGIAAEKAAIFEGLEPDGVAVLPTGLSTSGLLAEVARAKGARLATFGEVDADWCLLSADVMQDVTVARAQTPVGELLFKLQSPGRHFASNALGALAVLAALGGDMAMGVIDLGQWLPAQGRGTREKIALDGINEEQYFELIDDAFNANPASLAASLELLALAQPRHAVGRIQKGRRIAVLGDMLELGPDEIALHVAVASHPAMDLIDVVHCVGPRARALWEALPLDRRGEWHEAAPALVARAAQIVDAGDVVLVKGSKSIKVSLVVDALRKLGQGRRPDQVEGL